MSDDIQLINDDGLARAVRELAGDYMLPPVTDIKQIGDSGLRDSLELTDKLAREQPVPSFRRYEMPEMPA